MDAPRPKSVFLSSKMDAVDYGLVGFTWNCLRFGVWVSSFWGMLPVLRYPYHRLTLFLKNTTYGDRAISVLGLFVFQFCFWLSSANRSLVPWCVSTLPFRLDANLIP